MIQFPAGNRFDPVQPLAPGTNRIADPRLPASQAPADSLALETSSTAALELQLLRGLDTAGAAQYQLARQAVQSGDHAAALEHLEQAIQTHPSYAAAAAQDPHFDAIREPLRDLIARMPLPASASDPAPSAAPRAEHPPFLADRFAPPASDPEPPADHLSLPDPARAALRMELLQPADDNAPVHAAAALVYQLAREAARSGDPAAALEHLEQAILARPSSAEAARQDPVFDLVRVPVRDLVARLTVLARMQAESSIAQIAQDLELLEKWDDAAPPPAATAQYQLARAAAQSGDRATSLQHLAQAVAARPEYALTAEQDPAFDSMREPVRDLAVRLSIPDHERPEPPLPRLDPEPSRIAGQDAGLEQAKTLLEMAQAQFQLASYAGYVQAAQTALLAQQLAARSRISRGGKPASAAKTLRQPPVRSLRRAASGVTRRLWQRLPLLAILLGWLFAGILAGVASLPFHEGAIADLRQTLLPVWALGLLVMVLIGFIRSIRRIAIRRL